MKQAVKYIYWILVVIYFLSIVVFFFKIEISNYIMNHDSTIINFRSLTSEEHNISIKAQELAPKIHTWCMYYSFIISLITSVLIYFKVYDSNKTLKRIFFISLFWSITLFIINGISFIPTRGL